MSEYDMHFDSSCKPDTEQNLLAELGDDLMRSICGSMEESGICGSMTFEELLTPSNSQSPSPEDVDDDESSIISLSTAFYPGAHSVSADLIFSTTDSVLFYVHSSILLSASENAFCPIISAPLSHPKYRDVVINVPETSTVLNVILHIIYSISCAKNSPTFEILVQAVDQMPRYGIDPRPVLVRSNPNYDLLLSFAPLHPLELYALAARYDIYSLGATVSSHLLSYPLANISDDMAESMGPVYLKRLMCLHANRFTALKGILLSPPLLHPVSKTCDFPSQSKLTRAWALVSAYLAWEARPDLSTHSMKSAFSPLAEQLDCAMCKESLANRLKEVITKWVAVNRTI